MNLIWLAIVLVLLGVLCRPPTLQRDDQASTGVMPTWSLRLTLWRPKGRQRLTLEASSAGDLSVTESCQGFDSSRKSQLSCSAQEEILAVLKQIDSSEQSTDKDTCIVSGGGQLKIQYSLAGRNQFIERPIQGVTPLPPSLRRLVDLSATFARCPERWEVQDPLEVGITRKK